MTKQQDINLLIILNLVLAIGSNVHDFGEWSLIPAYLWPFLPICPLYPVLLTIWWLYRKYEKTPPKTLTLFTWIGIISYGIMSFIYYPIHMAVQGFDWEEVGNMLWVSLYAVQGIALAKFLKPVRPFIFIPIAAYFFIKDITDRFFGTFPNFYRDLTEYPLWLKNLFFIIMIVIHLVVIHQIWKKIIRVSRPVQQ